MENILNGMCSIFLDTETSSVSIICHRSTLLSMTMLSFYLTSHRKVETNSFMTKMLDEKSRMLCTQKLDIPNTKSYNFAVE